MVGVGFELVPRNTGLDGGLRNGYRWLTMACERLCVRITLPIVQFYRMVVSAKYSLERAGLHICKQADAPDCAKAIHRHKRLPRQYFRMGTVRGVYHRLQKCKNG